MKRYSIGLVAVLVLILPTTAKMESQKCGPYLVTFNLTTIEKMNFSQLKPVYYNNNVLYGLRLSDRNGNECGLIGICTFYQPASSDICLDNIASIVGSSYKNMTYDQITTNRRIIDGHLGFVVTGVDLSGNLNWKPITGSLTAVLRSKCKAIVTGQQNMLRPYWSRSI